MIHHIELWVRDLTASQNSLGWLLTRLGYEQRDTWPGGVSYGWGDHYIVIEQSTDVLDAPHDRLAPGLNHLAFSLPGTESVDEVCSDALKHGFTLMFANEHPYAGGPDHYAAYLEDEAGFEVELVATFLEVA